MSQTWSGFDPSAYETVMTRLGRKGLNLVDAMDDLDQQELARLVNMVSRFGSVLEVRPGQSGLGTTTGSEHIHSITRLNDPAAAAFTLLAGSATDVYRGTTGAFSIVDSNYSGDPLTFAQATAPTTGVPYTLIGDRSRNRKISRTGAKELIGAVASLVVPTVATAAEHTTGIARFDNVGGDGTAAASWTMTAGTDTAGAASGAPSAADNGDSVDFTTAPGGAGAGLSYFSVVSIAKASDLTTLNAGAYVATDDDLMNLRFRVDRPDLLEEVRVYLVCGAFTVGVIPGTSTTQNTDAFWKAFQPSDFSKYLDLLGQPASQTISALGDDVRSKRLREEFKDERGVDDRLTAVDARATSELYRTALAEFAAGRNRQTVTGVVGNPLRRGDFARIGGDPAATWATITGIVIVIRTNTNSAIVLNCDDWRLTGGGGPDTTPIGYQPYDFRYTHTNPATGVESNPSPVMPEATWVDALRQPLVATPALGSGVDSTWRQKFYRRGGSPTTSDDWYYDGINASDGGAYTTFRSDAEIQVESTLQIDHYQPVPSVDSSGATVLAKAVPIFFPVESYMFALGDTNQPQRLYRSKRGNVDAWPADEYEDVCAASDELLNGCEWGGGGYVFARNRMYAILLNSAEGEWTTEPTACREGLCGRWAMCWTPYGIAFVSSFGVRLTQGGVPTTLSDEQIGPLFRGETKHGFNPIDFTVPTAIKLHYHDHEIWFTYQDQTAGDRRQLIYNFFDKTWRSYLFGEPVSVVYSEPVQGAAVRLLMGSYAQGQVYVHQGFADDGVAIAYTARTGAVDFGDPAIEKLLGQILLDAELYTSTLTVQAFHNDEFVSNTAQTVVGTAGMQRYSFDPFGTKPLRARNISVELRGNAPLTARPYFNLLGASFKRQPVIVLNEATPWEEMPGGEGYLWGCILTFDTGNVERTAVVEYTSLNEAIGTVASLVLKADGRKKIPFSWTAVLAQQVRLRPTGSCLEWIRYKLEWLVDPEPPRVPGWNTNWDSYGSYADKWIKGYLIEADTFNVAKTVVLDIDQSLIVDTRSLTFDGRGIQQISFAKQRGKLFRLRATDANYGKLYRWQPIFDMEPLALTRWESQETDHGRHGWQKPLEAWVTLRSSATVTLQVISYGEDGTALATKSYTIASTAGAKMKRRVPFEATKGVLFSYLFTASSAFWLYREESMLRVEDWTSGEGFDALLPPATDDLMMPPRQVGLSGQAEKPLNQTS
jgi:hypothetical protein